MQVKGKSAFSGQRDHANAAEQPTCSQATTQSPPSTLFFRPLPCCCLRLLTAHFQLGKASKTGVLLRAEDPLTFVQFARPAVPHKPFTLQRGRSSLLVSFRYLVLEKMGSERRYELPYPFMGRSVRIEFSQTPSPFASGLLSGNPPTRRPQSRTAQRLLWCHLHSWLATLGTRP
jgi:hypothetical protein